MSTWDRSYRTIKSVSSNKGALEVTFQNGDIAQVPVAELSPRNLTGIQWEKAATWQNGGSIIVPAKPRPVEIPWYSIRGLNNPNFADQMAEKAATDAVRAGKRLYDLRFKLQLSKREVAGKAGISSDDITLAERGYFNNDYQLVFKILRAMGYTPSDLVKTTP